MKIKMKLTITKKTEKPFEGQGGDMIDYCWYNARRQSDQVNFQFGSMDCSHEEGESLDLNIEKREGNDGKYKYVEVV